MPWGGRCFFLRRRSNSPATEAARWFPRPGRGSLPRISTRTRPRGARGRSTPPRERGVATVLEHARAALKHGRAAASARPRDVAAAPPRPSPRAARAQGTMRLRAVHRDEGARGRRRVARGLGGRHARRQGAAPRSVRRGRRVAASAPNFPRGFSTSSRASTGATSWTATSYGSGSRTSRTGARASSPRSTPGRRARRPGAVPAALGGEREAHFESVASPTCSTARTIWRTRTRTRRS